MVGTGFLDRLGLGERGRQEVRPSAADAEFLTGEDIKDIAVEFAIKRIELDKALGHVDSAYAAKEEGVKAQYDSDIDFTVTLRSRIGDGIAHRESLLEENGRKEEEHRSRKGSLTDKIRGLRFNIHITLQEIKKKRLEEERRMFKHEGVNLGDRATSSYDEAIRDLEKQIEIARKLYDLDKQRWDINRPEYERRVKELTREKERVEEELNAARNNINNLKRFGVTRHTAGFLIWAGYASLAGVGGVIANLLSGQPLGGTDYISLIFSYLTNIVTALQTTRTFYDFWLKVIQPSLVVLVILALTGVLIWVVDKVLQNFDDGWRSRLVKRAGEDKKSRRRGRRVAEREDAREQPPFLTPDINRLSIQLPEVDRKSYVKLLALLPYLFLAFVVVLLSITGASPAPVIAPLTATPAATPAATPGVNASAFSMTYIGVVFALLTVSVCVLYATKVIEPRWRRLADTLAGHHNNPSAQGDAAHDEKDRPSEPNFRMYLRAHWEFIVIAGSLAVALLVVISLPAGDYRTHAVWSAVAVFMCFSSMAFAYGIIQRGLFRNEEYLDGRRALYRNLIEKYSTEPTIIDVFETVSPNKIKEITDNYRQSRQDLDELRMLYELKRHFADGYIEDKDVLDYWRRLKQWVDPFGFLENLSLRQRGATELEPLDYEVAPDEAGAVNSFREEQLHLGGQLEELAAEMDALEKSRSEIKGELRDLRREMEAQERKLVELKQSYEQEKARLKVRKEAECVEFKAAYAVGSKIADYIEF